MRGKSFSPHYHTVVAYALENNKNGNNYSDNNGKFYLELYVTEYYTCYYYGLWANLIINLTTIAITHAYHQYGNKEQSNVEQFH